MNATAMVAEHIDSQSEALIESWRSKLLRHRDVPQSASLTYSDFLDHVPILIERMADRLRGRSADIADAAEKHGHARFRQGYDMVEIVTELGHLRSALVESTFAYAREHDFDLPSLEAAHSAIHEVLNETTIESLRQFQEDSQAAAIASLEELESRNRAIEDARLMAENERSKLGILLANLPVGVWVFDADGNVIGLNSQAEILQELRTANTTGGPESIEITQLHWVRRGEGTDDSGAFPVARALAGEVVSQQEMLWQDHKQVKIVSASAAPLRDASGSIFGAVVVAQDVSANRQLQADLAKTSSQLRAIVEQSPVMIWRAGPDGRDDFVNGTFREFLGLPEQVSWFSTIHPDDAAGTLDDFHNCFGRRIIFQRSFRVRSHQSEDRWISSTGVPYHDVNGQFLGYLGSCLDVTDQIALEAAMERQKQIAEEASQHKSRLMLALSHDARTPLNAVVLSAQLLEMLILNKEAAEEDEVEQCLRTIRNNVKNVLDLLGDLLDLTRMDAGAMPVEISPFPLAPTLLECLSSIEPQARLKGLDCRVDLDGLSNLTIASDRAKLKQILSNFLSNALRYTDHGLIHLIGDRKDGTLTIAVQDSGIGIAPADRAKIFDEFATLENPRRPGGGGTGLGLAICRRLAGLLGGAITIDSEMGQGSTFTLVLPASILVDAETRVVTPPVLSDWKGEGAILVAEDHEDSRRLLVRLLRRMGYTALEAGDGQEVLDLVRNERPLAILMDVNMPGMNGIDATLALRADPLLKGLPIFALTGDVSAENQRRIGEAGVDGYLEKPVTGDALKQALAALNRPA